MKLAEEQEQKMMDECTFKPTINKPQLEQQVKSRNEP